MQERIHTTITTSFILLSPDISISSTASMRNHAFTQGIVSYLFRLDQDSLGCYWTNPTTTQQP